MVSVNSEKVISLPIEIVGSILTIRCIKIQTFKHYVHKYKLFKAKSKKQQVNQHQQKQQGLFLV